MNIMDELLEYIVDECIIVGSYYVTVDKSKTSSAIEEYYKARRKCEIEDSIFINSCESF